MSTKPVSSDSSQSDDLLEAVKQLNWWGWLSGFMWLVLVVLAVVAMTNIREDYAWSARISLVLGALFLLDGLLLGVFEHITGDPDRHSPNRRAKWLFRISVTALGVCTMFLATYYLRL